jgi:hypothetical protein
MKFVILVVIMCSIVSCASTQVEFDIIDHYKIITFGEMHGSNEMPLFSFDLVKKLSKKYPNQKITLGLEIPNSEQEIVDRLIKTGDEKLLYKSTFFSAKYQDGRASRVIVNGLKGLKSYENVEVVCFDQNQPYSDNRDTVMAQNIFNFYKKNQPYRLVIHSGNVHPKRTIGTPWDSKFKSMGYVLDRLVEQDDVIAIRGTYKKADIWVCQGMKPEDCGIAKFKDSVKSEGFDTGLIMLKNATGGYNAYFHWDELTPSKPWINL